MADPMTREKLRDLLSDMECGAGPDGGDILNACDDLIAQERAEVERLRAELAQVTTATTYLQGPEECLERECEEYFDDDGNERPGVEYCSHLKAKRLTVDEHLAAEAERDRLAEQVQRAKAAHATTCGVARGLVTAPGVYCSVCDALDGTEAGR